MRCGARCSHSSKRSGRLSSADGRRKPNSTSTSLRARSPRNIAADLRHADVALVHHHQQVVREVVEERVGRLAGAAAVEPARVVLDAVAEAHLLEHLEVVERALLEPLRLEQLALRRAARPGAPAARPGCPRSPARERLLGADVVAGRIQHRALRARDHLAAQGIDLGDRLRPRRRRTRCAARAPPRTAETPRPRRRARGRCRGGNRCRCACRACRPAGAGSGRAAATCRSRRRRASSRRSRERRGRRSPRRSPPPARRGA